MQSFINASRRLAEKTMNLYRLLYMQNRTSRFPFHTAPAKQMILCLRWGAFVAFVRLCMAISWFIIFVYGQKNSLFKCRCTQTTSARSRVCTYMCTRSFQFIAHCVPNSLEAWELRFHCPPQNWKAHQEIILGAATMPAMCHCHLIFQAFCALLLLSVPWGRQLSTHSSYSGRGEQGSRDHSF